MFCRLAALMDERNAELSEKGGSFDRFTKAKLQRDTGLAKTTINRLYGNTFDRIDKATVQTLLNYFDCGLAELFTDKVVEDEPS